MQKQTILTVIGTGSTTKELGPFFESAREDGAHVAVMIVGAAPNLPITAYGAAPYGPIVIPDEWQEQYTSEGAALKRKADDIEDLLKLHDVSGDVTTVFNSAANMDDAVARRAMVCDIACISDDLRNDTNVFQHILHGLLFNSPLAVALNGLNAVVPAKTDHVFIAWNTGLPSARAVHAALPAILAAKEVTIATFDPVTTEWRDGENPGSALAAWLSHHGASVTVQQYASGGKEIGTCIMERAEEVGADMIVMGAYGHSRMREALFGGTTRTLTEQTKLPVVMAH